MDPTSGGSGGGWFGDLLGTAVRTAGEVFTSANNANANAQAAQATAALAAANNQVSASARSDQTKFLAIGAFALIALFVLMRQTKAA